jgi:hypothetical protein
MALQKRLFCEIFSRTGYFVLKFMIKVNFIKIVASRGSIKASVVLRGLKSQKLRSMPSACRRCLFSKATHAQPLHVMHAAVCHHVCPFRRPHARVSSAGNFGEGAVCGDTGDREVKKGWLLF